MEQRYSFPEIETVTDLRDLFPREDCVWEILRTTDRPIVLYGTGNGGDKLISALENIGRKPDGVFASDGFVRNRTFHDMPVVSLADAEKIFGHDMMILAAFGSSIPDVMDHMRWLDENYEFFMPELPLYGGDLFDYDYFMEHIDEINEAFGLLTDSVSRDLFCDILRYRLSGRIGYLEDTEPFSYSLRCLTRTDTVRTALDGGAYTGDTAREMRQVFPHLKMLIAAEPDARTFRKLSEFASTDADVIHPVNCALGDTVGTYTFSSSGSRGSGIAGRNKRAKTVEIQTSTVDTLCEGWTLDLLKLDIEGDEAAALRAAENTIRRCQPALAISLYHRSEDLFALPRQVFALCGEGYSYHLRRVPCYPAWDLMLYAIPARLK